MNKKYFILFSNCILTRGAIQSSICDLQIGAYALVPNFIADFLAQSRHISMEDARKSYTHDFEELLDYLKCIERDGLGFWCDEPGLFPEMSLAWDSPCTITNCIIDIDEHSNHGYGKIFSELESLGCDALQIRAYSCLPIDFIDKILSLTKTSRLTSMELIVKHDVGIEENDWVNLCLKHGRIKSLIVHSSPCEKQIRPAHGLVSISYSQTIVDSDLHCGIISPDFFTVNLNLFSEAKNFNSCLNRKVGIDVKGNIKNCPSMQESFGNIQENTITSVIHSNGFRKSWSITKDQVEVCKDCEFRYICTDCRAFITDSENLYSKSFKCRYNPYTATWEDQ